MLGNTNAVISSGGGGNVYGVEFGCDYVKNLLDNSVNHADKSLLNTLGVGGTPKKLTGQWEYKPGDLCEYLQNILIPANMAACKILRKIKTGAASAE